MIASCAPSICSISVDPEYDTPEVLAEYAGHWDRNGSWTFLTGAKSNIDWISYRLGGYFDSKDEHLSIFLIVHFYARRVGGPVKPPSETPGESLLSVLLRFESVVFFGALTTLIVFLSFGKTPFLSVTISLGVILALWIVHPRQKISWKVSLWRTARRITPCL